MSDKSPGHEPPKAEREQVALRMPAYLYERLVEAFEQAEEVGPEPTGASRGAAAGLYETLEPVLRAEVADKERTAFHLPRSHSAALHLIKGELLRRGYSPRQASSSNAVAAAIALLYSELFGEEIP